MEEKQIYQKNNSFAAFRSKASKEKALARIRACVAQLPVMQLDNNVKAVVEAAWRELSGTETESCEPRFELHSNVIDELDHLDDLEIPRYLHYRYRYEIYPARRILDNFPPCLQIEPASICNYRCVFCYQTDKSFAQKASGHMGNMSLDLFQTVVDEAHGKCEAVTLASRGEPLICPDIDAMLHYAQGKFLALKLNTNAWFLDERHAHAILESGVNTIVFSVDAASEPMYSQLRVGGQLDRVVKNIRLFQEIRYRHYPHSRTISRVSGVQVPGTPDLNEMERFWGDLVDQVAFVHYNPWENTYERDINDIETPCSDLWRRMFVWWDGTTNPCDVDYKSTLAVGRVPERSLSQLWVSDKYSTLREHHSQKRRSTLFPCQRCTLV